MIKIIVEKSACMHNENIKTVECPNCKLKIHSWSCPINKCRRCSKELVNANNLVDYKMARLNYHKRGPY